ncbi:MAG: MFS transporter [Chloroflexi bacterium]|nr:MFS transporter [Chloroflexota bacterium]
MRLPQSIAPLFVTPERRRVLLALATGSMLVQMSSLPVALSLPTLADEFNVDIDVAAWIVIAYLLAIGSGAMLGARIGDRYGHARVFFVGILGSTLGAGLIVISQNLLEVVAFRALSGLGAALIIGNANAILVSAFPVGERGRAFSIPIIGSRIGTLSGLATFGLSLEFATWRIAFLSFLPIGLIATFTAYRMMRHEKLEADRPSGHIDYLGGILLVAAAVTLVLSTNHLHGGDESFTTSEAISYHVPMQILFLFLVALFILVERRVKNPVVDLRHFRNKYFSLSLVSNTAFHFSMLAAFTLVPIVMEEGFGLTPLFVMLVLVPNQSMGIFLPLIGGSLYDKHGSRLFRPGAMVVIAMGFLILGLTVAHIPAWTVPLIMLPITAGTSIFNPINNATVMSSLPLEHRGVASGMLETTRELGHALGATVSATALSMFLPEFISTLSETEAQGFYLDGFRFACLMVVGILIAGAVVAYFHKAIKQPATPAPIPAEAA